MFVLSIVSLILTMIEFNPHLPIMLPFDNEWDHNVECKGLP